MALKDEVDQLKHEYRNNASTIRLALSYLTIIMVLSIAFSVVFYKTSIHALGRQIPPPSIYGEGFRTDGGGGVIGNGDGGFTTFFTQRYSEGRNDLLARLVLLNVLAFFIGSVISFYLARASLEPIEEAMEAQSRFSSDASHELRTPLTAIRTRNEVALRKPKLDATEAKQVIQSNLDEVIKLEMLSEGLLRLARQDGKPLELSAVGLDEIATEAINKVIEPAQAKNIVIDETVPKISVLADSASLAQAVKILLDNAIKYSSPKSKVFVSGYKKGKHGFLQVKDQGQGIKVADLPHIFDRFYRADHARTKKGENGYGLGLSIAQKIIEQHGGEITVKSIVDKGSTFTIKLTLS
ncbi:MAG TPA: ATP-binding protein [Candidatus Saccharimonadales bacterium]|nr:ATP-binding protein [Candidatus Saccharimonadales bacterium]